VSDLETRVQALEADVTRLREDGVTTRMMAALADRDAAEARTAGRADTGVLQALRDTQIEQGRTLQTLAGAVGGLNTQVADLAAGQAELTGAVTEILRRLPPPPAGGDAD
jgi:hypothetical protein